MKCIARFIRNLFWAHEWDELKHRHRICKVCGQHEVLDIVWGATADPVPMWLVVTKGDISKHKQ